MWYLAVENIMGGVGLVRARYRHEEEAEEYIDNYHLDLSIEAVSNEEYEAIMRNGGYIE